jgi:methylated-DNA-[protein]-cysteine S-methyltransferase
MKRRDEELIAMLLGDSSPSPRLQRWLDTDAGQRELRAYREVLTGLRRLHGDVSGPARQAAYYNVIATPVGRVLVATTEVGLVRVAFRQSEAAFTAELRRRLGTGVVRSPAKTKGVARQLEEYFAGQRRTFDVPTDLRSVTPFQRRVLLAAVRVPAGQVVSYGDIARSVGRPGGSRAVGQALGRNPIPIVIPCHRVVAAGGRLGGYSGGLAIKKRLLRLEGALVANG